MPEATLRLQNPSVFRLGLATALVVFLADQAAKLGLLFGYGIVENGPIRLTSFLDIVEVWNRGISYGLLQQDSWFGRWLLIVLSVFASGLFALWLWRTHSRLTGLALGLIIGGALGNVVDRAAYGAVFDFVHLHVGGFSWYVFNVADAAIVAGVIGLLYESFRPAPARSPS
jgi:signal peptidase II